MNNIAAIRSEARELGIPDGIPDYELPFEIAYAKQRMREDTQRRTALDNLQVRAKDGRAYCNLPDIDLCSDSWHLDNSEHEGCNKCGGLPCGMRR